jgi:hypothetical protein
MTEDINKQIRKNFFIQTMPASRTLFEHSDFNLKNNMFRLNDDGSKSTVFSITVTDPLINNARPTLIPTIYNGVEVSQNEAIKRALQSKKVFPSFSSIEKADQIAPELSELMGD